MRRVLLFSALVAACASNTSASDGGDTDAGLPDLVVTPVCDVGADAQSGLSGLVRFDHRVTTYAPESDAVIAAFGPPGTVDFAWSSGRDCCSLRTFDETTLYASPAGTIALLDGSTTLATLKQQGDQLFYQASTGDTPKLRWRSGDSLTAKVDGERIGSISGTVVAPSRIEGVTPEPPETGSVEASVGRNLAVTWTPGDGPMVSITLTSSNKTIACWVQDSGSFGISRVLLVQLGANRDALLTVSRMNQQVVPAGDAKVLVEALDSWSTTVHLAQ